MKTAIAGVDTSVSSSTATISATTIENFTYPEQVPDVPYIPPLERPENIGVVSQVVNGIVTPNLRVLLASVLGAIDASIPNKEQNKAVKHIVRTAFDDAYCNILERSYPDCEFGFDGDYNLKPESNRAKAYADGFLKLG